MSIFKTKGILLKIDKIGKNDFLYTIFSYDYGKIKANKKISKKEKNLDLGYIINFEIETKKDISIHKIKNIKILSVFSYESKNFTNINNYLGILAYILHNTPEGVPIYEIYNIFEAINKKLDLNEEKFLLTKLKIKNILGLLNINSKDEIVSKILKFIDKNNINDILKLTGIKEKQIKELENLGN